MTKQVGIYRDDGRNFIQVRNGPLSSRMEKTIIRLFQFLSFKIVISSNHEIVNFFDITFKICHNTLKPFHTETLIYININSNNSNSIVRKISNIVNTRINGLSSNKTL